MDEDRDVEFLAGTEVRRSPSEQCGQTTVAREPNFTPLWFIAAGVVAVGIIAAAGALLSSLGNNTPDLSSASTTLPQVEAEAQDDPLEATSAEPIDSPRILGSFDDAVGYLLPAEVETPPLTDGVVLLGHGPSRRLALVDSVGSVTELLGTNGPRFVPLAKTDTSVVGFQTFTGDHFVVTAEGTAHTVSVDLTDAPVFIPLARGAGYAMHATTTGEIVLLDRFGAEQAQGIRLASGVRVIGDTTAGLVIGLPDGTALIIEPTSGEVVRELDRTPLATAGESLVGIRCDDVSTCRPVVTSIDGSSELTLPVQVDRLERLLAGLSPGGKLVVLRGRGTLDVIDIESGRILQLLGGYATATVSWLDDTMFAAHLDSGEAVLWSIDSGSVMLDIRPVIDPSFRGITLLRVPSATS